jgi:hypothetical protein
MIDFLLGAATGVIATAFAGAAFSARVRAVAADAWARIARRPPAP